MKNVAFRVSLAMVVAALVACGGTDSSVDERIPAEKPASEDAGAQTQDESFTLEDVSDVLEGEVTAQNHGCPRDPYACVHYCQTHDTGAGTGTGRGKGKCTGSNRSTCSCTHKAE